MINNTLIEAMVSSGLSRKAEFAWDAEASDLKTIIGRLAEGTPALPPLSGEDADLSHEMGLAYAVAHVWDKSNRFYWPQSELRRVATIAMQMGSEVAELVNYLPHIASYMCAFVGKLDQRIQDDPSLKCVQALCFGAVLHAKLSVAEKPLAALVSTVSSLLQCYMGNPELAALIHKIQVRVIDAQEPVVSTRDFAALAQSLFVESGRNFPQEPQESPSQDAGSETQTDDSSNAQLPSPPGASSATDQQSDAGQAPSSGTDSASTGQGQDGAQKQEQNKASQEEAPGTQAQSLPGQDAQSQERDVSAGDGHGRDSSQPDSEATGNTAGEGQDAQSSASQTVATNPTDTSSSADASASEQEETKHDQCGNDTVLAVSEPKEGDECDVIQEVAVAAAGIDAQATPDDQVLTALFAQCEEGSGAGKSVNVMDEEAIKRLDLETRLDSRLVTAIQRSFEDTRIRPSGLFSRGNKLAVKKAWRFKSLGDSRVWKHDREEPGMDLALSVLVDRSQSMRKHLRNVCLSAMAFAVGLSRISGTKSRIAVFPSYGVEQGSMTILDYGQPYKQGLLKLETLQSIGTTPLAEAIIAEAKRLIDRNEQRKVIVVMTDGKPDNEHVTHAAIRFAENNGVEVIGIGFGEARNIQSWMPKSEFTPCIDALPEVIENIFREKLLLAA